MKAIILAAGMASRLRPLTDTMPKCLLKVGERSLLQRSIDALCDNGIRQFVFVTGYRHEMIEDFVTSRYPHLDATFIYNEAYSSTNNIYSLWLARPEADGEEVLLLDSDLLYDPHILGRVISAEGSNILTLIRHDLGEEEMKVVIDDAGHITAISKKCNPEEAIGESLGIERMSAAYTRALYRELDSMMNPGHHNDGQGEEEGAEDLRNVFYERAFERLIPQGHTFSVVDVSDLFSCELDTVYDFNEAKKLIPPHLY